MRKMRKKTFAIMMALVICFAFIPSGIIASELSKMHDKCCVIEDANENMLANRCLHPQWEQIFQRTLGGSSQHCYYIELGSWVVCVTCGATLMGEGQWSMPGRSHSFGDNNRCTWCGHGNWR